MLWGLSILQTLVGHTRAETVSSRFPAEDCTEVEQVREDPRPWVRGSVGRWGVEGGSGAVTIATTTPALPAAAAAVYRLTVVWWCRGWSVFVGPSVCCL
ncbi:hypothetical protein J6590_052423 [Homalodisca vitripennis]|nr:hypothetical protein J6590_052423 [Homalodisca vitripennis]